MGGAACLLLAAAVLFGAAAVNVEPEIRSSNFGLDLVIPENTTVRVVFRAADGTESAPVALVTQAELSAALSAQQGLMQAALDAFIANTTARFAALTAPCPANSARADPGSPCLCLPGFSGALQLSGASYVGICTAVPCPANTVGIAPACLCDNGFVGSVVPVPGGYSNNCQDLLTVLYTNVSAAIGSVASELRTVSQVTFSNISMLAIRCPPNAARTDASSECVCNPGFTGTLTRTDTTVTGTCTPAPCPPNSTGTPPACLCNAGFVGSVVPVPGGYSSNCQDPLSPLSASLSASIGLVSGELRTVSQVTSANISMLAIRCPANAARPDATSECACNPGFTGTLTRTGTVVAGTCTPAPCPVNSAGTPPACLCSPGFVGSVVPVPGGYSSNCQDAVGPLAATVSSQTRALNMSISDLASTVSTSTQQLSGRIATVGEQALQNITTVAATKITASPTCQCVDPLVISTLAASAAASAFSLNSSLSCGERGLVFARNSNTCSSTQPVTQTCTTAPPAVFNGVLSGASCAAGAGSGAVCVPQCNAGFTLTGFYVCVATAWGGTASCVNRPPQWVTPAGSLGTLVAGYGASARPESLTNGQTLLAVDAENVPLTYTITAGTLPPGLSLRPGGVLVGQVTPGALAMAPSTGCAVSGTYTFTVTASDGVNAAVARSFSIAVSSNAALRVLTFTTVGQTQWQAPFSAAPTIDLVVVAGGGGGSTRHAGGGGAGGVVHQPGLTITPGLLYPVFVGAGGAGAPFQGSSNAPPGTQGQSSSFDSYVAIGGGAGGSGAGGSGGGGIAGAAGGAGTAGQGFSGRSGCTGSPESGYSGGGGGGAGGTPPQPSCGSAGANAFGGVGGPGISLYGFNLAAGGGGGVSSATTGTAGVGGSAGGVQIGGSGSRGTAAGGNGAANTGSGGGGGGLTGAQSGAGGTGGSGIVIVRWCENL